jgi:hypothetical protein
MDALTYCLIVWIVIDIAFESSMMIKVADRFNKPDYFIPLSIVLLIFLCVCMVCLLINDHRMILSFIVVASTAYRASREFGMHNSSDMARLMIFLQIMYGFIMVAAISRWNFFYGTSAI